MYKAWDEKLKRLVAVKLARFELSPESRQFQRLTREAESAARLAHPGILQVFEFGEEGGRPFIIGQLASGGSLAERIERDAIGHDQAARWMLEICEAIEYAHQRGVIHRDIKPANVPL